MSKVNYDEILTGTVEEQIGKLYNAELITDEQYDYLIDSNGIVCAERVVVFSTRSEYKNVHLVKGKYYVAISHDESDPWGISRFIGNRETSEIYRVNRDTKFKKAWDRLIKDCK